MNYIAIPSLTEQETRDFLTQVAEKAKDGMTFVEIGTFVGGTICHFGQMLKKYGKKVTIYAVDNFSFDNISAESMAFAGCTLAPYDQFMHNVRQCDLTDIIKAISGDSIKVSSEFEDKSIDFIYIDGVHGHPYNDLELDAWLPKMKDDSIVAGHDYKNSDTINAMIHRRFPDHTTTPNRDSYIVKLGKGLD